MTTAPGITGQPGTPGTPPQSATATGGGAAVLLVGTRIGLLPAVQLLLAGLLVTADGTTAARSIDAAAAWWMVYSSVADVATLVVLGWLLRRGGASCRGLLGPPTPVWQIMLGALGVLAAGVSAMALSAELTAAVYEDALPPMFAVVDLPPWAGVFSVLVVPLLAEFAEPVAYLGVLLPQLERRVGRPWLAATLVVVVWAVEHGCYPLLTSGDGLDLGFTAYRVVSVLPFLATWTAAYYALGRRLIPIMAARWVLNGGTAFAVVFGPVG